MLKSLEPYATEVTMLDLPSGQRVGVPTYAPRFLLWSGPSAPDPLRKGINSMLDFAGVPLYAELAIVRLFEREGWKAVWANSYSVKRGFWRDLPGTAEPYDLPTEQRSLLDRISWRTGFPVGCWDVFAWRDEEVAFAEAKRTKRDRPTVSQRRWLEESLREQIPLSAFFFVEWDLAEMNTIS